MQLTLDNRAATAERKLLELEELGYRFKISRHADGREVYLFQATPAAIMNTRSSELLMELRPYQKELCQIITDRAKRNIAKCRQELHM